MPQALAGPEIERLIQLLARLPGLGPRSARRAVLHLMRKREDLLLPLAQAMQVAGERIVTCSECGNLDTSDPCSICRDPRRDRSILMVVESVGDLWALERAGALRAVFLALTLASTFLTVLPTLASTFLTRDFTVFLGLAGASAADAGPSAAVISSRRSGRPSCRSTANAPAAGGAPRPWNRAGSGGSGPWRGARD
jgi:hypothetical protein